jgi:predicted NBD/HSP70 family sugar kinase
VLYAIVGFGLGLGLFGVGSVFSSGSGLAAQLGASFAIVASVGVPIAVTAVFAFFVGREINDELSDLQDNLVFATAGVTAFAGSVVAFLLSWILFGIGVGSVSFGDFLLPIILTGIGAAVIAVGTIWADENLLAPSGVPPQDRQQY